MTSLIEPVAAVNIISDPIFNNIHGTKHNHKCRHVLKSKENTQRHKCNKALKRKLKQYKLRPDGKEDQDILDVSDILINSLTIKSPGSKEKPVENQSILGEKPKNYLFRMVRNKQKRLANSDIKHETVNTENNIATPDVTQDKKQTNAFKLLMDSRNKSIGSNSPGKEKPNEENLDQEIIEKKNVKAKRVSVLQKMAEAKGSLKRKEIEESQDKYITVQMKKRADKFKNMLLNQEPKSQGTVNKTNEKYQKKIVTKVENNNDGIKTSKEPEVKQAKTLQLVSLFNNTEIDLEKEGGKKNKEQLSEEDKDFLEKLSPSLKKKGNMLSYLTKIEKDTNSEDDVIRVKLPTKSKRKDKSKKKHIPSDDKICNENLVQNIMTIPTPDLSEKPSERQKRKRNFKLLEPEVVHTNGVLEETHNRPKRTIKKPVKYNDDIFMSSSDEELHIFTPKKKRNTDKRQEPELVKPPESIPTIDISAKPKSVVKMDKPLPNKSNNIKLAPIFNSKQKLDPVASEAKQKFLQSGVPEKLKKMMTQQKCKNTVGNYFQTVVHVQQIDCGVERVNYSSINISSIGSDSEIECPLSDRYLFSDLLNLSSQNDGRRTSVSHTKVNVNQILQQIKQSRPKFPVYRTYRLLRDKKKGEFRGTNYLDLDNSVEVNNSNLEICNENPEQLSWTDKYKAMSTNQIIGNFESVKELKKWLVLWTEMHQKSKSNINMNSDSSDFYQSDTDSRDSAKSANNLLIITGPTGSGKTSSVYAVAADLAIKVIEVNASSKRTGKIMLQDLQEATQSHKVNRGATSSDNNTKSQELVDIETIKKTKKRGRPKKQIEKQHKQVIKEIKHDIINALSGSQEIARTDTSLILIDDADIVFDQDDGFCSAISQLVHSSKRPVILVASSLSCPHLQRFLPNGKILKMNPQLPRMLGTWLDLLCLADSGSCCLEAGGKFLNYFKGDVRKTINSLHFYVSSQSQSLDNEEINSQNSDTCKLSIDDEKSSTSWADQEDNEEKTVAKNYIFKKDTDYLWNNFIQTQLGIDKYPYERFDIWWNLPQILNLEEDNADNSRLGSIANVVDSLSVSDYFSHITPNSRLNITSEPWFSSESHSVSEQEDMNSYRKCAEVCEEISYELIKNSINNAQQNSNSKITDIEFPGMSTQRERDRIVTRHNNLTSYLNPPAAMDRRALALDYWSSCRAICRIEKNKSENQSKRNNRFCHYLKSLNIRCKNESFDNLCSSLSSVKNCEKELKK